MYIYAYFVLFNMINDYTPLSLTNRIVIFSKCIYVYYIYIHDIILTRNYIHLRPKCNSKNLHFNAISLVWPNTFSENDVLGSKTFIFLWHNIIYIVRRYLRLSVRPEYMFLNIYWKKLQHCGVNIFDM